MSKLELISKPSSWLVLGSDSGEVVASQNDVLRGFEIAPINYEHLSRV